MLDTKTVWFWGGASPFLPISRVGMDFNENGIIDEGDVAAVSGRVGLACTAEGYERKYDLDFSDTIESSDLSHIEESVGYKMDTIRRQMDRQQCVLLEWPDGFQAYLCAINGPYSFVEPREALMAFTRRWITVHLHPYETDYICGAFAHDTMTAAYKAFGYGRLLVASSGTHAYNAFWNGEGDWHDWSNWRFLEPQQGDVHPFLPDPPTMYDTKYLWFPQRSSVTLQPDPECRPMATVHTYGHVLVVDVDNLTVDYGVHHDGPDHPIFGGAEELPWDVEASGEYHWDTSLGVVA